MAASEITILFTGDIVLNVTEPLMPYFEPTAPLLRSADLVVGQVEKVFTDRGHPSSADPGASYAPRDPAFLSILRDAHIDVATLAGNHIFDAGTFGIQDTIDVLKSAGIACVGAGMNLEEARRPAVCERNGIKIGILSYNAVGPRDSWATADKAGAAFIWTLSHYEVDVASPGMAMPRVWTFCDPESVENMQADIQALRDHCDVVCVSMHKGIVHAPGVLAMYERPLAHAAIDAGADVVVGHHAHLLRGVEVYQGKPIFHGLNNYVAVMRATFSKTWLARRRKLNPGSFDPDPAYPTYPFHPESRHSAIAKCTVSSTGVKTASLVPLWIDPSGAPNVATGPVAQQVVSYMEQMQEMGGLDTGLSFDGSEVRFL